MTQYFVVVGYPPKDAGKPEIIFGDYERDVAKAERQSVQDGQVFRGELKKVETIRIDSDNQSMIDRLAMLAEHFWTVERMTLGQAWRTPPTEGRNAALYPMLGVVR